MQYVNNNDAYGMYGPFEAKSLEASADAMADSFRTWAGEAYDRLEDSDSRPDPIPERGAFIAAEIERIRSEYLSGLEIVQ